MISFKCRRKTARSSRCTQIVRDKVNDAVNLIVTRAPPIKMMPDGHAREKKLSNGRFHVKREAKWIKLHALPRIVAAPHTTSFQYMESLGNWIHDKNNTNKLQTLLKSERIYANGSDGDLLNQPDQVGTMWRAGHNYSDFEVFDSIEGGYCEIATTVPRERIVKWCGLANDTTDLFDAYQHALNIIHSATENELENTHRRIVTEDGNNKFLFIGKLADQGKNQINEKPLPKGVSDEDALLIQRHLGRCALLSKEWMDTDSIIGLDMVNEILECHGNLKLTDTCLVKTPFPSAALVKNGYVSCHVDLDFTLSVINIVARGKVENNCPILVYFCFPTLGRSIALRNGDQIIFDPRIPHFMSSRPGVNPADVICIAQYCNNRVAGGNNKSQDLSKVENIKLV